MGVLVAWYGEVTLALPRPPAPIIPSLVGRLLTSQNVDVVYIGTPVTHHHKDAKAALLAGKHVVCEKPFTFDLAELDELIAIAREKKLFLME